MLGPTAKHEVCRTQGLMRRFFARSNTQYRADCSPAKAQSQYSSSSPRKRKRDEPELDNSHKSDTHHPKRLNSRDEMPPPPIQRAPRRELQPNAPSVSKTRAPQHREVYERRPVTPTLRDTFQDLFVGQTHPSQLRTGRSQDWEAQPYLDPSTEYQSRYDYGDHFDHRDVENQPITFVNAETNSGFTDPTYDHDSQSSSNHQNFAARPAHPRGTYQESTHSKPPERLYSTWQIENTQQHQERQMRYPLRPVQTNQNGSRSSMRSPYLNAGPRANISPAEAVPPTAGSVSSPFFQQGLNAPRIAPTSRPSSRAGNGSFLREQLDQHDAPRERTGYPMRHEEPVTRDKIFGARNGQQFSNGWQSSTGYRSFEQAPSSETLSYREPMATSQAQSDIRRPLVTRAYVPPLQYSMTGKQNMTSPRGRITLPPSTSGSQDYGILNMRGVRGGVPYRAEDFSASRQSGHSDSRPLFAPVSRRSVRR